MSCNATSPTRVCVTGGAGYIGSWLVKKLLHKGYTVNATLRDLNDSSKVDLLKGLPYAEERLMLFEANIYNPDAFQSAIHGCEFVFHLATPLQHTTSKFKNMSDAAIAGVKSILESCIRSKTVKRVIYTATVMSASSLAEDGTSFKKIFDESCWTPLDRTFSYMDDFSSDYVTSKTLVEKEVLKFNDKEKYGLDVVSLVCSLVVGDTILPYLSPSQETIISDLKRESPYKYLNLLQEMLGSIPLAHIDDISEAHIFCMEKLSKTGRILCAQAYPTWKEVADYYKQNYPEFKIDEGIMEENERVEGNSTKLTDEGFEFKYDVQKMLDDTVNCARRLGSL